MLFFAVSSAGSCSPTSLPGFRHPGFRLSFRSSLLSGSLPSSRLSLLLFLSPSRSSLSGPYAPPPGILLGALLSLRFSPLLALSPLGSLSSPLYPLPGFLFSSCSPPLALLLPACPLLPARTLLLPAFFSGLSFLSGSLPSWLSPLLALSQVLSTLFPAFSSPLALPLSLFSSRLVLSFRPVRSSSRLVLFSFRPFFLQLPLSAPPAYSRSRSEPPALRSRSSSRSARLSRIESRIVQRLSNSWASMRGCSSLTTRMMSFIAT